MVAGAFSRLPKDDTPPPTDDASEIFLIDCQSLANAQKKKIPEKTCAKAKCFRIGDVELKVNRNDHAMAQLALREHLMEFHHGTLRHPGIVQMTQNSWINFAWSRLKEDCIEFMKQCDICQRFEKNQKHCGHLLVADPRISMTQDQVAVDSIGPWTIEAKNKTVKLTALTALNLSTRWIQTIRVHEKTAENGALLFDRGWII